MISMITPKRDLYPCSKERTPLNLYGKIGKWYKVQKVSSKYLTFLDEYARERTYFLSDIDNDYHTIDFKKGFDYKSDERFYNIKEGKIFGIRAVDVGTCLNNITEGWWEITRFSNEKESTILKSFPVPEDNATKEGYTFLRGYWGTYTDFEKHSAYSTKPYNPVKNISREKYYRCAIRPNLCDQFNSDQGILFMSESFCGKYYYWEGYNSENNIIYFRGEKSWVEGKYEKVVSARGKYDELYNDTLRPKSAEDWRVTAYDKFDNALVNGNTWTDKHYDFNYTLTEDDIEKGVIKIDPYFVAKQWKLGSKDDSGALWHTFKGIARFGEKNSIEREIRAFHAQIKRLAELNGVKL